MERAEGIEAVIARPARWARVQRNLVGAQRALRGNPNMAIGVIILVVVLFISIFAPLLTTEDPQFIDPFIRLRSPGADSYFGTDQMGRDVFSRTLHGGRVSLRIGLFVAVLTMAVGTAIGVVTGYYKLLDNIVMRFMDGLMAIPSFLLAIALVAILGASFTNVVIAITVTDTPRTVRLVRGSVLSLREREFVQAAQAIGARPLRILSRHVLPNLVAPLLVQGTYIFAVAILVEAGLSFLGAGVPPYIPSWGNMMGEAKTYVQLAVWIIFFPGLFLSLTVLGANLLGDGLRDTLDPRLRRTG